MQKFRRYGKGRGLIHRDLKPGNIFLANVGRKRIAKIGDYGLSKAFDLAGLSSQTMSGDCMGTPCFMPRQQLLNFKYAQPEVDVWAAAASLYFMLTRYFPRNFAGNQDPFVAILQQRCGADTRSLAFSSERVSKSDRFGVSG